MVIFGKSYSNTSSTPPGDFKKRVPQSGDSDFRALQKIFCSFPWHEICFCKLRYDHIYQGISLWLPPPLCKYPPPSKVGQRKFFCKYPPFKPMIFLRIFRTIFSTSKSDINIHHNTQNHRFSACNCIFFVKYFHFPTVIVYFCSEYWISIVNCRRN